MRPPHHRSSTARHPKDVYFTQALTEVSGTPGIRWETPASLPPLPSHVIHIWRLIAGERPTAGECLPLLDGLEQQRADRLVFAEDRQQFLACRATLRLLLAHYLGTAQPRALALVHGQHGKPTLAGSDLQFNLSHTRELGLFAFARGIEVGVDVETIRAADDLVDVAESNFAPEERAALETLPALERTAAFYRCWTRKEALLKAEGSGLFRDLNSFAVPIHPAANGEALSDAPQGWELAHLDVAGDAPGAVAWQTCVPMPQLMLFNLQRSLFL